MFADFNSVFHPEKKWGTICLSKNSPCLRCKNYLEYEDKAIYGNVAERQYAKLPDSCNVCAKYLIWLSDCIAKLEWYEKKDESIRGIV